MRPENSQTATDSTLHSLSQLFEDSLKIGESSRSMAVGIERFLLDIQKTENSLLYVKNNSYSEPEDRVVAVHNILITIKELSSKLESADNFSNLHQHGGLEKLKEKASPRLLSLEAIANDIIGSMTQKQPASPLSDHKKSKTAVNGFTLIAQHFKIKKAYKEISKGRKFKKALQGENSQNPIKALSGKNIIALKEKLRVELEADIKAKRLPPSALNRFGLKPDEMDLFAALLDLPYKMQHATNHFSKIARDGRLNSLTEIHRHDATYRSSFSTSGNLQELGNGGFVFSRVYVEGTNGDQTRYGNTRIISDLSILREIGWVSLHDQLVPFSKKNRKQALYVGKKLLCVAEPTNIHNIAKVNKSSDAIKYTYRIESIVDYYAGQKDTQKAFGIGISTRSETISFTEEIFYGKEILLGIALSVIYRLRHLAECGYRAEFLKQFNKKNTFERVVLLGQLVKDFYRTEGKYPVALPLQYHTQNQSCFFVPYAGTDSHRKIQDRKLMIENPDGDGQLNLDLSINRENARLAFYNERLKFVTDQISVLQKFPNDVDKKNKLTECKLQKQELEYIIKGMEKEKQGFINVIKEACSDVEDCAWLMKRSYEFLKLLSEEFLDFLEDDPDLIDTFANMTLRKLSLMSDSEWLDLVSDELIGIPDLITLDEEMFEEISAESLRFAMTDREYTFKKLIETYQKDRELFDLMTCEDLTELAFNEAPDVSERLYQYAEEIGYEIDFEYIRDNLSESELMMFNCQFPDDEESEVLNEDDDEESEELTDESNDNYPNFRY